MSRIRTLMVHRRCGFGDSQPRLGLRILLFHAHLHSVLPLDHGGDPDLLHQLLLSQGSESHLCGAVVTLVWWLARCALCLLSVCRLYFVFECNRGHLSFTSFHSCPCYVMQLHGAGAIAFALVFTLSKTTIVGRSIMITTAILIVMFTVFVQVP